MVNIGPLWKGDDTKRKPFGRSWDKN